MSIDEPATTEYMVRIELDSFTTIGIAESIYEMLNGYGRPAKYSTLQRPAFIITVEFEDDFELGFTLAQLMEEIRSSVQSYGYGMIDRWSAVGDSPPIPNGGQPSLT